VIPNKIYAARDGFVLRCYKLGCTRVVLNFLVAFALSNGLNFKQGVTTFLYLPTTGPVELLTMVIIDPHKALHRFEWTKITNSAAARFTMSTLSGCDSIKAIRNPHTPQNPPLF
jgi:hypothetical protein